MMTKQGPSGGEDGDVGARPRTFRVEDGKTTHPFDAELSASLCLSSVEQEIEETRRRLQKLEEMLEFEIPPAGSQDTAEATAERAEVDTRSIYVGNVDYACCPEEVEEHFQECGTVNRVTILTDSFGQPKGFAYVEFDEAEAVQNALLLNESELHGRPLKVCQKRTNIPGMSRASYPVYHFDPTYGKIPLFRRFSGYRYSPYY